MKRRMLFLPVSVVAIVLVGLAAAWACTIAGHQAMEITGEPDAGAAGKVINVSGVCSYPCVDTGNRDLWQAPNTSGRVPTPVTPSQTTCSTGGSTSTDIGSVTTPVFTGGFSGTGTVQGPAGPKIICAGVNPSLLWDNYTVL